MVARQQFSSQEVTDKIQLVGDVHQLPRLDLGMPGSNPLPTNRDPVQSNP
jgi:hypothetical protein